jgi:predicted dehydrogenase
MRTVKAAVIGTGFIGPAHVEALRRLGFVEVVALVGRDPARTEQKAAALGVPRAYSDWRRLLDDKDIEIIHNCTPNHLHFEINKAILEAGKHCLSEKPLATTTRDTRDLLALAKQSGLVHAVNFNYRFYPLVQHAKAIADDGELGDVYGVQGCYLQDWLYFDTDYSWRLEPELAGASCCMADLGSHWCDLVCFITGRRVVEVIANLQITHKTRKRPKSSVAAFSLDRAAEVEEFSVRNEDHASAMVLLDNGATGVLTVSEVWAGRKNQLYCEIGGSRCSLGLDLENPNELWIGHREKPNETTIKDPGLLKERVRRYAHYPAGHPEGYPDGPKNLFRNVYLHLMGESQGGDYPTFLDGHNITAVVEAVIASHRSRQWTKVAY